LFISTTTTTCALLLDCNLIANCSEQLGQKLINNFYYCLQKHYQKKIRHNYVIIASSCYRILWK